MTVDMPENADETNKETMTGPEIIEMAWFFIGGGALSSLYLLVKRNQDIFSWIFPLGMIGVGIYLFLLERQKRIAQTGDQLLDQLEELDPITRAEVIKYMTEQVIDDFIDN